MGMTTPTRATAVATPASAAETVVLTLGAAGAQGQGGTESGPVTIANLPTALPNSNSRIRGALNITTGATATAVIVRCRRLSLVGTQVGTSQTFTLSAASTSITVPFDFLDPATPNGIYVITVAVTGQSTAGAVNEIVASVEAYQ